MKSGWETPQQRMLRLMAMPPKAKLEWLYNMAEFLKKYTPKRVQRFRKALV